MGVACACLPHGAQAGATRRASGFAARYIYRSRGHGRGPSCSPCHSASGVSSPVGHVAVACACALVLLWILCLPCPARREERLSRPCPRRGGVVALAHTVGGGTGSGSYPLRSRERGSYPSRLTLVRGERGGLAVGKGVASACVFRSTLSAEGKCQAKMEGGGSDVQMADAAGASGSI